MGVFSSASANSRPSTPAVCSARARVPALGPRPAASTINAAHTSSGIARRPLKQQAHQALGDTAEAAGRRQQQEQAEHGGEQGAEGRHGRGLQRASAGGQQMPTAEVRLQEARGVIGHVPQVVRLPQRGQVRPR